MAQFDLQLPKFGEGDLDDAKQRRRIMSYLYKLDEQLRFVLNNLDAENFTEEFQQTVGSGGGGGMTSYAELENELGRLSTQIRQTAAQIELKADAEELNELGDAVSQVESDLKVIAGKIESTVTRTEFDKLGNQVAANRSAITQTAEEIRSEVADEVAGLNSTISQTAGAIRTEVSNTAAGLQSQINQTPEKIELAVENVRVGGTNYLLNSGSAVSNATYNIANYQFGTMKPVAGEIYTLRIWGSLGSGRTHFTAYNTNGYINLGQLVNNGDGTFSVSITWKNNAAESQSQYSVSTPTQLQIYQFPRDGTSVSTITRIKLEKGNKETDWSPHPDDIQVGGRNLLRNSRRLTEGNTGDTWSCSAGAEFYQYGDDGFRRGKISMSGLTADGWRWIASPIAQLPVGWQGRQVTVSAYIYSPDWTAMDHNVTCSMSLSKGDKNRQNYANWVLFSKNHGDEKYGPDVQADRPLESGKWLKVSMTFTLDQATLTSGTGTFDDNTHMYVTFWLRRNGDFRFYAPKLEWGNKATDWSPHPEEFEAGTNVLITKDQFKVKTPEFSVDIPTEDGTETMLRIDKEGVYTPQLESPNVAQRYDGPGTLYVNPNATSAQIAAGNYFRALKDVLSVLSYKALTYAVTVNIAAGHEESGTLTLRGVYGGQTITINGNSSNHMRLYGRLNIWYCAGPVLVRNVDVIAPGVGIEVSGSPTFSDIYGCVLTGPGISVSGAHGIHSNNGAMTYVGAVEIYDFYRSMYAMNGGVVAASECKGNCNVAAQRSTIYMTGGMPCASTTWGASVWGGQAITGGVTVDQGSKPSAPAVTTKTVSYKANNSDVYAGGGWNNYSAEDIYQGYTTALGEHRGCFWFDNATIRSALNGKTIKQATLTLYQMGGVGRNQPVQVNLEGITATSGAGSSPVGKPEYGVIGTTLGVNQATTFTLPTAVITDLVKGTINGLMLRTGETSVMKNDDNSYHYARFAGKATAANAPVLTVVYA